MKTTRDQLKALVKECLLEILSEGLGSVAPKRQAVTESVGRPVVRPKPRTSSLDQPVRQQSDALKRAIIAESGGNPALAEILADTAATTLQTMLANDRPGAPPPPTGTAERAVAGSTPEELFGEDTTSRWANLAFADAPSKKSA